jgi:hypothetical protein
MVIVHARRQVRMFTHQHYVPILKWKQGEYQALHRLAAPIKDSLTPLLEILDVGFDHEAGKDRKTIDSHLSDFGRRLKAKWPARSCFVDLKYIDAAKRMTDGRHYVEAVFADARAEGCWAIPVVSLASDARFLTATAGVIRTDRRGACLRLTLPDFDLPNLATSIATVLGTLSVGYADTDLIIDLAAPNFQPVNAFVRTTLALVAMVPMLNRWRTFTVAGTSYPARASERDGVLS